MRVLSIYYEIDEPDVPRCLQLDMSKEKNIWIVADLLSNGRLDEVRFVGETYSAIGIVRMLVRAGHCKRASGTLRHILWVPGDEVFPRQNPYVFIRPDPEPAAFI